MKFVRRILCSLGIHRWSEWDEVVIKGVYTKSDVKGQIRSCRWCGEEDWQ